MYGFYLQEKLQEQEAGQAVSESFLVWHRSREYDAENNGVHYRGGRHQQTSQATLVVACRFWFELTDGYWGQFSLVMFPHADPKFLLPQSFQHLVCMQNFCGILEYLSAWRWSEECDTIITSSGFTFSISALPMRVDDDGKLVRVGHHASGQLVFSQLSFAYDYIVSLATRDLQYRGMRDERLSSFEYKCKANFLLFDRVRRCSCRHEYALGSCGPVINLKGVAYAWHPCHTWHPCLAQMACLACLGHIFARMLTVCDTCLHVSSFRLCGHTFTRMLKFFDTCLHVSLFCVCGHTFTRMLKFFDTIRY